MRAKLNGFDGRRSQAALRLIGAGTLAVMLAGCYQSPMAEDRYPTDYRLRHPITLQEGQHNIEIFVGRNRGSLTMDQRADVLAFAQQWRREANSGIVIDAPWGGPADRATVDLLREIRSIFAASGVPQRAIYVRRHHTARSALASIRIGYSRLTAKAGPCGLWPNDLGPAGGTQYLDNQPYWNFGCATQRNLAAMVANPSDLVEPRATQPAYEARRTVVLDKYRQGQSPSATYSGYDTGSGNISNLGK